MPFRIAIFLLFVAWQTPLYAQQLYYISPAVLSFPTDYYFGVFDLNTCQDSAILRVKLTSDFNYITDVAVCPNGNFYLLGSGADGVSHVGLLNLSDSSVTILNNNPTAYNSLTCNSNSILYGGSGFGIFSYDTNSGASTDYGFLGIDLAGDLTFINNELYGTAFGNDLIRIDPNDLGATQAVFNYALPDLDAFGVVTDAYSCDSSITYITTTNALRVGITDTLNQIYRLDLVNQTVTLVCETPFVIFGAATPNEYLASDCSVRLDLDYDDSSLAPGADFQAQPYCGGGTLIAVADTDAVFYSGYRVDSLRIRLLPPAPDGASEYLNASVTAPLGVSGQNSHWLTLHNLGGAKALDFQAAIRSVRWQNIAATVTPGLRTVEFVAFASGGRSDTALAFIPVPLRRTAGRDTALAICADGLSFALASLLSPTADPSGSWQPVLPTNGLFDPAGMSSTFFQYILPANECPGDTASIDVLVRSLPVFSLGPDRAFCAGDSIVLGPVGGTVTWQDGQTSPVYSTDLPGLYWAETTDADGCRFRDSVALTRHTPVQVQETLARCFGQPYVWQGTLINRDTLLCDTLTGVNGCDSMHCLALSFYYPLLAVDTVICSGQSLPWQGQVISTPGTYQDTLLLAGCWTAIRLQLNVLPSVVQPLNATICAGDTFVVGSQSFTAAGPYQVLFQTPTGCDSLVQLQLTVQQSIMTTVVANICPGGQYPWAGAYLTMPGTYTDLLQTMAGCDSVVTLTLGGLLLPAPVLAGDTLFCPGETTTLQVGSFAAYGWSTGASTAQITVTAAGAYTVTVTNVEGCTASAMMQVAAYPDLMATWETSDPLCPGGADGRVALAGVVGGRPPFHYQLGQGPLVTMPEFDGLPAGLWMVTVTDSVGCAKTYSGALHDPGAWTVDIGPSPLLEAGGAYSIPLQSTGSEPFMYIWSPAAGLSCTDCPHPVARPDTTMTYTVIVTDADGCTQTASLTIQVARPASGLYVPTVFSPNDDGENDYFNLFADPLAFRHTELLRVYDRWGSLVFEAVDLPLNQEKMGWDGQARGKDCLPGIYPFYAEVRLFDGSLLLKTGEVLLVR